MKAITYSEKAVHLAHLLLAMNGEYKRSAIEGNEVRCNNLLDEFHLAQHDLGKELGSMPVNGKEALSCARGILLCHYAN
jgi:hypothetical protein